jgi:hypothetical protein
MLIFSAVHASAAPRISDPASFVAGVYQHFVKAQSTGGSYMPPRDIFTARLSKLVRDDINRSKGAISSSVALAPQVKMRGAGRWTMRIL